MRIKLFLAVLVGALAGCAAEEENSPLLIEREHAHYHVHAAQVEHDHAHESSKSAGHTHEHAHQSQEASDK